MTILPKCFPVFIYFKASGKFAKEKIESIIGLTLDSLNLSTMLINSS